MNAAVDVDAVIVGGGIAGSTLAANLAGAGLAIEVLERETEFIDRVRGEWMAPWGVAEAKTLGLYDRFMNAGGHHTTKAINYDELLSPAEAEAALMPLGDLHPDAPGPLCMEHVTMQNVALDYAIAQGASVKRGVGDITIEVGRSPAVSYTHGGDHTRRRCRLVIGADGRSSTVRRQLGLALREQPLDHLISGLLVEGADAWPSDVQSIGKAGDAMCLVFPQGGGKVRLYVDYDLAARGTYTGEHGAKNLLNAFDVACIPGGDALARATPIGPCHAFPSQDAALDRPYAEGAVLIGDAAGYSDPIFGQGLSVVLRDARLVRDALLTNEQWRTTIFDAYAEERRERMRRIMQMTRFGTTMFARFDEMGIARRTRAMQRMAQDPALGALVGAAFSGPEAFPAECFTDAFYERLFAP